MSNIFFIISKGFEKSGGATRAMQFAAIAAEQGNEVEVALIDDAIHWAQFGMAEGIRSSTGEQMKDMLEKLVAAGAKLHVCKACADKRYVDPDDIINGAVISGGPDIVAKMADPQRKVVTF
ncbi:MAG: sulfur reduction protein DsrE [Desulfovibrio sp.]|nr:MAG: sulfur reduction protein DsrE [Desulfovibrio sp.]